MDSLSVAEAHEIVAADTAAADHLLLQCGRLQRHERVVIVADESTRTIGKLFSARACLVTDDVATITVLESGMHGHEPSDAVRHAMAGADLVLGLTRMSMAHTRARREAAEKGVRYLSMPDYDWTVLSNPALLVDYQAAAPLVRRFCERLTEGGRARVTTAAGTDITIDLEGRRANFCPGYVDQPGGLGSPPDIEANISPLESGSNGVVVVDGSIPCREIGLLAAPVTLTVKDGAIVDIDGPDRTVCRTLDQMFAGVGSDKAYVLAECGIGLNPAARLCGNMLIDEGAMGCVHFGFGSNATVGGVNDVPFHLDFVLRAPRLTVDDNVLIDGGEVLI